MRLEWRNLLAVLRSLQRKGVDNQRDFSVMDCNITLNISIHLGALLCVKEC